MTNCAIYLLIQPELYWRFQQVSTRINTLNEPRQAKALGTILADLACAVLDQVFTTLIPKASQLELTQVNVESRESSQQVIDKITSYIQQYMPYAVSFFHNQRLSPMVNYLAEQIRVQDGHYYLSYEIDDQLAQRQVNHLNQIRAGEDQAVKQAFADLVKIIDIGVDALIVKPKALLKFNFLLNKTLDGVIYMSTQMGYQRLEKVSSDLTAVQAIPYLDHFFAFVQQGHHNQSVIK